MAGSGRRVFTPGEVLSASNVMNYLQDQAVMTFAGTAARGSAIGTAVSEGMVSYLADSNVVQAYTGSSWDSLAYKSQVDAIPRVGLIPVVPTSITTTSGSASFNSTTGLITLSSCGDAILNGVFTSTYRAYKIIFTPSGFTGNTNYGAVLYFRFSSGGTTNQTYNYSYSNWYTQSGSNGNGAGSSSNNWGILGYHKDFVLEIFQPANASTGTELSFTGLYNNTLMLAQGGLNVNQAVDGIQFANNFYSGTMQVYGYN